MNIADSEQKDEAINLSEENLLREVSLQQPQQFFKAYLSDEREDLYQEYLTQI